MKKFMILVALLIGTYAVANCQQSTKKHFIRIYNTEGKKNAKGFLIRQTSNSITLMSGKDTVEIQKSDISKIKNGRSAGHYILIGTVLTIIIIGVTDYLMLDALVSSFNH